MTMKRRKVKRMKIVVEVSEKDYLNFMLQYDSGILDEKTPSHRAKIAIAEGQILPDNAEILTAEAYSDLCIRASRGKENADGTD